MDKSISIFIVVTVIAACVDIWFVKDTKKIRSILNRWRRKIAKHRLQDLNDNTIKSFCDWITRHTWNGYTELSVYIVGFLFTATMLFWLLALYSGMHGNWIKTIYFELVYFCLPAGLFGGYILLWLRTYLEWAKKTNIFFLFISVYFIKLLCLAILYCVAVVFAFLVLGVAVYWMFAYNLPPSNTHPVMFALGYFWVVIAYGLSFAIIPVYMVFYFVHFEILFWIYAKSTAFVDRSISMLFKVTKTFYFSTSAGAICTFGSGVLYLHRNISSEVQAYWTYFWTPIFK